MEIVKAAILIRLSIHVRVWPLARLDDVKLSGNARHSHQAPPHTESLKKLFENSAVLSALSGCFLRLSGTILYDFAGCFYKNFRATFLECEKIKTSIFLKTQQSNAHCNWNQSTGTSYRFSFSIALTCLNSISSEP